MAIPTEPGTSATPGGMAAGAGQGMPDLGAIEGDLGKFFVAHCGVHAGYAQAFFFGSRHSRR